MVPAVPRLVALAVGGNGWYADNTEFGIGGVTSVTLRAYNSAGQLIDIVVEPVEPPQTPSP